MENKKYICKLCYREFNESEMVKNVAGSITDYCRTCNDILGKGVGYADTMSEEEINLWLADTDKRKASIKDKQLLKNMKKAVVLISGGIDSTTVAYQAKRDGYELFGVSFLYGQKAQEEIECAKRTMKKLGGKHLVLDLNILEKIFKSPLINDDIRPELNKIGEKGDSYYIVPLRNMVFLSIACAYAESIGAERIYIGSHKGDFNGFPDCRAEFISALQNAIDKGTAKEQTIVPVITAPWQFIDKSEIIEIGKEMGVDYNDTYSCYQSGGPCGVCESCILRAEAFRKAGL